MSYQEGTCSNEPRPRDIDNSMDESELQPF